MELNKLYKEDNQIILKSIPDNSIDLILEDMPYNVTNCDYEYEVDLQNYWIERKRVLKENGVIVLTATQPFTTDLISSNRKMFKYEMIWNKIMTSSVATAKIQPLRSHENVLVFYSKQPTYNPQFRKNVLSPFGSKSRTNSDVVGNLGTDYNSGIGYPKSIIEFSRPNNLTKDAGGLHPAQKPIDLFRYIILTYTNMNDIVFDGFAGSGTTAIACLEEKRKFICCEWSDKYFPIANKRINEKISYPALDFHCS